MSTAASCTLSLRGWRALVELAVVERACVLLADVVALGALLVSVLRLHKGWHTTHELVEEGDVQLLESAEHGSKGVHSLRILLDTLDPVEDERELAVRCSFLDPCGEVA